MRLGKSSPSGGGDCVGTGGGCRGGATPARSSAISCAPTDGWVDLSPLAVALGTGRPSGAATPAARSLCSSCASSGTLYLRTSQWRQGNRHPSTRHSTAQPTIASSSRSQFSACGTAPARLIRVPALLVLAAASSLSQHLWCPCASVPTRAVQSHQRQQPGH